MALSPWLYAAGVASGRRSVLMVRLPWVTGSEEDSNTLLQEYNELNDWLVFNYELDSQIGNFFIWRRKT